MDIVLTSHGTLCEGLANAFSMFAAQATNVHTVRLDDSGIDDFRARLGEKVKSLLDAGSSVLIMSDLEGGTPYNESLALMLAQPDRIRLVSGTNLPMLVEAGMTSMGCDDLDEVYEVALQAGSAGVKGAEISADESNEDEDLF